MAARHAFEALGCTSEKGGEQTLTLRTEAVVPLATRGESHPRAKQIRIRRSMGPAIATALTHIGRADFRQRFSKVVIRMHDIVGLRRARATRAQALSPFFEGCGQNSSAFCDCDRHF